MFFRYLHRELRHRLRQSVFVSVGLALGIGLVIFVTAVANVRRGHRDRRHGARSAGGQGESV